MERATERGGGGEKMCQKSPRQKAEEIDAAGWTDTKQDRPPKMRGEERTYA